MGNLHHLQFNGVILDNSYWVRNETQALKRLANLLAVGPNENMVQSRIYSEMICIPLVSQKKKLTKVEHAKENRPFQGTSSIFCRKKTYMEVTHVRDGWTKIRKMSIVGQHQKDSWAIT